jgi:hypothetical protein
MGIRYLTDAALVSQIPSAHPFKENTPEKGPQLHDPFRQLYRDAQGKRLSRRGVRSLDGQFLLCCIPPHGPAVQRDFQLADAICGQVAKGQIGPGISPIIVEQFPGQELYRAVKIDVHRKNLLIRPIGVEKLYHRRRVSANRRNDREESANNWQQMTVPYREQTIHSCVVLIQEIFHYPFQSAGKSGILYL